MKIFFPKEQNNETRIAIVPLVVKKYVGLGAEVAIESGAGKSINIDDKDYAEAFQSRKNIAVNNIFDLL